MTMAYVIGRAIIIQPYRGTSLQGLSHAGAPRVGRPTFFALSASIFCPGSGKPEIVRESGYTGLYGEADFG